MNLSLTDLLGYAAAGLVLATFSFRSITALRSVAIASNLMFIAYAAFAQLAPVLILHALLLPLNMLRLYHAYPVDTQDSYSGHRWPQDISEGLLTREQIVPLATGQQRRRAHPGSLSQS